ncbi:Nif3-like dinuclear metal center hexameric protein [Chitiniphilus purpureus]|uniref:Nif3-like dinuclear metal center hexameric protein n=1 Tax=Chitiniphilus purpureus TaxID=2981137 RepID=A0ABY6DTT1_9NEIS|nr:Nif3-like dinuclear metal center hexameric protein [Chitiniphilus sp. CD1]UXY15268.1 Nif3-like dinuclear metal center hexameric protein [Chitiniphilus sp. CD1]
MAVAREQLSDYIEQLLEAGRFRDYCPNGLQVEGRERVGKIATAVTASLAAVEAAVAAGADALLVHHGYFWKGEQAPIRGLKKERIASLLAAQVNLFAYHLPLDAHPTLGNNAQLASLLGLVATGRHGEQDLVWLGEPLQPVTLGLFAERIEAVLGRRPLVLGERERPLRRVAWCTGGAQGYFHEVASLDVDCYVTGEASEFVTHVARESGVAFIAAGHHATERYGVRALGDHLAERFALDLVHLELDNPI